MYKKTKLDILNEAIIRYEQTKRDFDVFRIARRTAEDAEQAANHNESTAAAAYRDAINDYITEVISGKPHA